MNKTIQPRLGTVVTMIVAILFLFLLFSQAGKYNQSGYIVEKAEERLALNKERKKAMLYIGVNDDVAIKVRPIEIPLVEGKNSISTKHTANQIKTVDQTIKASAAATEKNSIKMRGMKRTYIVRKGDTLFGISQRIYGDGNKWRSILKSNKNLSNPNGLRSGMKLVIPEPIKQNSAYLKWQQTKTKRG